MDSHEHASQRWYNNEDRGIREAEERAEMAEIKEKLKDKNTWFCYNCDREFEMNEACFNVNEEAYCRNCHSDYISAAECHAESCAENLAMEE